MNGIEKQNWGKLPDGRTVDLFILRNSNGIEATITNLGGRLVTLKVPDRNGHAGDVVLGFDNLDGYVQKNPFFGALVGRYANRIANGEFKLDGQTYHLARNNGENSLHGGIRGFDKVLWQARQSSSSGQPVLELSYLSKDGEEGYPGDLMVTARYSLNEKNELRLEFDATTDKDTVLNLTNHSYFNLAGHGSGNILHQIVTINGDKFTPVNANLIPTGELRDVSGTPFDFRKPTEIGARIDDKDQQMQYGQGYDHNYDLNRTGDGPSLAARVEDPESGRVMEVLTTQPGMQFYTGNHLEGKISGKAGATYAFRGAYCFETQHFPDSPNHPEFPTTELKPGQQFQQVTIWRFSVK